MTTKERKRGGGLLTDLSFILFCKVIFIKFSERSNLEDELARISAAGMDLEKKVADLEKTIESHVVQVIPNFPFYLELQTFTF